MEIQIKTSQLDQQRQTEIVLQAMHACGYLHKAITQPPRGITIVGTVDVCRCLRGLTNVRTALRSGW